MQDSISPMAHHHHERIENNSHECRVQFNVLGMSCVKCTQKIEKALLESPFTIKNLKIDFITNRVVLTVNEKDHIQEVVHILDKTGFKVTQFEDITQASDSNIRNITLKILAGKEEMIADALSGEEFRYAIEKPKVIGDKCVLTYNSIHIRGSQIIQKLQDTEAFKQGQLLFVLENPFEDDQKGLQFSEFSLQELIKVVIVNVGNVLLSFLPEEYTMMPKSFGMFSFYFIAILVLTIMSLKIVGFKIYLMCLKQLKRGFHINMLTLVAFGSGLALIFGFLYTISGLVLLLLNRLENPHFFMMNACHMLHTSATIFTSLVVGKYIEGRIKRRIYSKIALLTQQLKVSVDTVERIVPRNKKFDALSTENLAPILIEKDDYVVVKNQKSLIPFDGFIEKGTVKVVENIQYGWEKVETKTKGHPVLSGSHVIDADEGTIMRVTQPLEKTLAGRLFHEIKEAASGSSSNSNKETDILAAITKYFISTVVVIACLTFFGWTTVLYTNPNTIDYSYVLEKVIAVLVASCPCALGIAIPMVYAIALRKGFKAGALIKDTSSLDILKSIDTVVFDKTGTITGTYNIGEVNNLTQKYDNSALWEMISLVEKEHLQHPIGLALYQEAIQRMGDADKKIHHNQDKSLHEYHASEGVIERGLSVNGKTINVALGNEKLLQRLNIECPRRVSDNVALSVEPENSLSHRENNQNLETCLYLCIDQEVQLCIALSLKEALKHNITSLFTFLRKSKKEIRILTGDSRENTLQISKALNISPSNIKAGVNPEGKEKYITDLIQQKGKKVLMIGDGINDIKAFKAATLSCSINFKSSQNLTFSDFIIINNDLNTLSGLFNLAQVLSRFKNIILVCALIYNVPVILAASGVLKSILGVDLAAYFACWTMIIFSLFLTIMANIMEFINIRAPVKKPPTLLTLFRSLLNNIKSNKGGYTNEFNQEESNNKSTEESVDNIKLQVLKR